MKSVWLTSTILLLCIGMVVQNQKDFGYPVRLKDSKLQSIPTTTRSLFLQWKKNHADERLKAFTFVQETIRFENDQAVDTSIWYEAVTYPDKFRIDFGEKNNLSRNLFRNDSIYVLRKGTIVHQGKQLQESLIIEGGLYEIPVDSTLEKLESTGINTSLFCTTNFNGRPTYIVGAKDESTTSPQIWVDAQRRYVVKRFGKTRQGNLLEVRYDEFVNIDGYWVESWVEFYVDNELLQTERYENIMMNPTLSGDIFNPTTFQNSYWY